MAINTFYDFKDNRIINGCNAYSFIHIKTYKLFASTKAVLLVISNLPNLLVYHLVLLAVSLWLSDKPIP